MPVLTSFAKWIEALTALMSGKRLSNKGVAGVGRPPSLLVMATSSAKSLKLLLDIINKHAYVIQLVFMLRTLYMLRELQVFNLLYNCLGVLLLYSPLKMHSY